MKIILILLVILIIYLSFNTREKYSNVPDICVHMMETGFSNQTIQACENYANKCGDTCDPYPIVTEKLKELYNKYGVGKGSVPSTQIDLNIRKELLTSPCILGVGPGNDCVDGEEDCQAKYVCNAGKCRCPSEFNVYS